MTPSIYVDRVLDLSAAPLCRRGIVTITHTRSRTVENLDREPLGRDEIAKAVAADIPRGSFVNLGIGQPTKVADYLTPDSGVVLHTENGMLGMGPEATGDEIDPDLTNAGKIPVTELPGAAYFHHADSFAMMRGGHLDVVCPGRVPGLRAWRPRELAHRGARCDPRCRWRDGSGDRCKRRLRDDDPVQQGRDTETGAAVYLSAHRVGLRQPGLHRAGYVSQSDLTAFG